MSFRIPMVIAAVIGLGVGAWLGLSGPARDATAATATNSSGGKVADPVSEGTASSEAVEPAPMQSLSSVDRTVPSFELLALDNTPWTPETLQGKPWVINFWATWCPPCIEEIPSMNAAFEVLEPQGVGMLAINAGEGGIAVEQFLEKISIDFPNVLGDADTLPNWSVRALPTTIVVDAEGRVIYEALGPREWDDERLLQNVIDLL